MDSWSQIKWKTKLKDISLFPISYRHYPNVGFDTTSNKLQSLYTNNFFNAQLADFYLTNFFGTHEIKCSEHN